MRPRNVSRKNTLREKAWKIMRTLGTYTLTEVATLAEADYSNIGHYHQCLVAAGYVRQEGTRKQEGRPGFDKIFRLIKNTGPKAPIQKDLRFVFDQNTGKYWSENPEVSAHAAATIPLPEDIERRIIGQVKVRVIKPVRLLAPRKKKAANNVD